MNRESQILHLLDVIIGNTPHAAEPGPSPSGLTGVGIARRSR
jgi:hypothetical protein